MNIEEHLVDIGFTQNEARTYLALLEMGETKTGKLCDRLNIASSHIYRLLESLINKGVASYKLSNNIKIFKANDPSTLNELFLKKEQELRTQKEKISKAIQNLQKLPKHKESVSDYKYFEGTSGIRALWLELTQEMKENSKASIFGSTKESWEAFNAFYLQHHKARIQKQVQLRMLMPVSEEEEEHVKRLAKQREDIGLIDIRFDKGENQAEFGVYEDLVYIQDTSNATKTPRGFLIKDKIFANLFQELFEKAWKKAKK